MQEETNVQDNKLISFSQLPSHNDKIYAAFRLPWSFTKGNNGYWDRWEAGMQDLEGPSILAPASSENRKQKFGKF